MKAEVNWMEGWANPPKLVVHMDDYPDAGRFIFEERNGCYFAVDQASGVVRFFYYAQPGRGYGGRDFTLRMKDGSERTLSGPWSSRCACMNEVGFPHSVECVIVTKEGHNVSGALLIDKAKELLRAADEDAVFVYDPEGHDYEIKKI